MQASEYLGAVWMCRGCGMLHDSFEDADECCRRLNAGTTKLIKERLQKVKAGKVLSSQELKSRLK